MAIVVGILNRAFGPMSIIIIMTYYKEAMNHELNRLYCGDCLTVMAQFPPNFVDTIITDPPYGLSFMGKEWDHGVPGIPFWAEMLRICKPGAMLLSFGGTRTFHRMTVAIEDAGWEIRDCLMWLYGSGFPKSHNLHDKFEGYGTALKPAWEPIIVAMKPLDGTFAQNAEKWGVAGVNVDGGRIRAGDGVPKFTRRKEKSVAVYGDGINGTNRTGEMDTTTGRWPANLILDEEAGKLLDEQTTGQLHSAGHARPSERTGEAKGMFAMNGTGGHRLGDSGGASRFFYVAKADRAERNEGTEEINTWGLEDQRLAEELNQHAKDISEGTLQSLEKFSWNIGLYGSKLTAQSQKDLMSIMLITIKLITVLRTSRSSQSLNIKGHILSAIEMIKENGSSLVVNAETIKKLQKTITEEKMGSALGASVVVLKTLSLIKDSVRQGNGHPTIKPLSLMKYLCNLTKTPTGGIVLDPFAGSGTTLWAAECHNRPWIGIEKDASYIKIAEARLARERSQIKFSL